MGYFWGFGCHLDPGVAVARALTEAVQCRLTEISGHREDIKPRAYQENRDEEELREVLKDRALDQYFDGVFGSPAKKYDIITNRCFREGTTNPQGCTVYCGDSRLDYEVAMACDIKFIMIYGHTEWEGWRDSIRGDILCARDFTELIGRLED